jgi:hypothetical protein
MGGYWWCSAGTRVLTIPRGAQNAAAGEMQAYLDDLLASPGVAAAPPLLALLGQR